MNIIQKGNTKIIADESCFLSNCCSHSSELVSAVDAGSHSTDLSNIACVWILVLNIFYKRISTERPLSIEINCVNKAASAENRQKLCCQTAPGGYFWLRLEVSWQSAVGNVVHIQ